MRNSDAILPLPYPNCGIDMPSLSRLVRENFKLIRRRLKNPLKALSIFLIAFYQRRLSRHTCLYTPTCSEYTKRCINNWGVIVGIILGLCRIVRCNPFSKGGVDPAPEVFWKLRWLV